MTFFPNFTHANISGKKCRSHHICIFKHKALAQAYLDPYILTSCGHLHTNVFNVLIIISIWVSTKTHPKVASPQLEFSHRFLTYTINKQKRKSGDKFSLPACGMPKFEIAITGTIVESPSFYSDIRRFGLPSYTSVVVINMWLCCLTGYVLRRRRK